MILNKYDSEALKKLQSLELMILKDFASICDENNLEYFIYGGSALGAVRHDGFIPWDDDIDIIMFRKDYEKFLEIMSQSESDKYEILSPNSYPDYFFLFSKIMIKGTKFEEWWVRQVNFNVGINIDIFVLNNVSDNKIKRFLQIKEGRILDRLLTMSAIKLEGYPKATQTIANLGHSILNFLHIKPERIKKRAEKVLKRYENEDTEFVCDISALNHPQIYRRKDFIPSKKFIFENHEFPGPSNVDAILKNIYGDYMELPPKDERYNHIPEVFEFGKYE